MSLRKAFW